MDSRHIANLYSEAGKVVASVYEENGHRYLYKVVEGSKHFLRRPPAIAFDAVVITEAKKQGATRINALDKENGKVYSCSMAQFEAGALSLDRGFGKQLALPMGKWNQPEEKPDAQPALIP